MRITKRAVLVQLLDTYERCGQAVSSAHLATSLEADAASIAETIERLERMDLVVAVEGGYRPTVTAREMRERGLLADRLVIVDPPEDR